MQLHEEIFSQELLAISQMEKETGTMEVFRLYLAGAAQLYNQTTQKRLGGTLFFAHLSNLPFQQNYCNHGYSVIAFPLSLSSI